MSEAGLDALLIPPSADLRYLTGYDAHALERLTLLVLPAQGAATLVVPRLERPAAEAQAAGVTFADHEDGTDPYPLIRAALGAAGTGPTGAVGLGNRMWAEQVLALRAALPEAEQRLAGAVLAGLRLRKSPEEVEALRRAGQAIDAVHARMGEWLRAGRTEDEVAADIAVAMREAGHATVDFTIVAAGPNGASPHHGTSDRVIGRGEPVVVDIGGRMPDGYCSDSTRTYCVGEPPAEFREYYAVLHAAQRAAVAAVRPGVSAEAVDAAARDVIAAAGYGPAFLHRTGHGIGLDGHEDPYIVAGNTAPLEPGMAFSVEPGIYLAGRHGARIEDIVVCTADGVDRLNIIDTELVVL
ncbi:Xaa-Pro peptidase family protein [Dactylosporangium sp. AC04546]|uniref:M24 family metallopeptidase n=1 Tax=Dactylosporangium sp. AC04546 TaxID=2862460 RepID=UPI001EDDC92D|nr:Xaa-Pro peptidase family protein [Dactylosporangium sp. AC04546]WVK89721.1 Xaa-Pro peptidase family protein [Dactylosporangium sp. AC04546]